jgi:hypothetical protein
MRIAKASEGNVAADIVAMKVTSRKLKILNASKMKDVKISLLEICAVSIYLEQAPVGMSAKRTGVKSVVCHQTDMASFHHRKISPRSK